MSELPTDASAAAFVAHWKKVSPLLDQIRREELRNLTHQQCQQQFSALLEFASKHRKVRSTSGLVEQQRIFRKAHP